jgi:hypothetical protein
LEIYSLAGVVQDVNLLGKVSYRLAADDMKTLLGFLSVIAVELLQLTYLHRT